MVLVNPACGVLSTSFLSDNVMVVLNFAVASVLVPVLLVIVVVPSLLVDHVMVVVADVADDTLLDVLVSKEQVVVPHFPVLALPELLA